MLVNDTTHPPWNAVCSITVTAADGTMWRASGVLISPRVVLTAAHAVYLKDAGGWASVVQVTPGRRTGEEPFGSQNSTNLHATLQWVDKNEARYDYGAIVLSKPFKGAGTLPMAVLSDRELMQSGMTVAGYPGDKALGSMWAVQGPITNVTPGSIRYRAFTWGGMAGGPILVGQGPGSKVVGIHSLGLSGYKEGIRITPEVMKDLKAWIDEAEKNAGNE